MELPNYSRQLLQQLYTLCKEQQFCDCTISIGSIYFRAHKLVLAAASLLFKTLLDSTDTISIDASMVSPEEFALLLEMMYTGKLPVGKHNFSKIISLADSLQMFDVAVSCKNLLTSLVSCSSVQDQVVRVVAEPLRKEPEKPQVKILYSEGAPEPCTPPEGPAPAGSPVKAEAEETTPKAGQEPSMDRPTAQESPGSAAAPSEPAAAAGGCSPAHGDGAPALTKATEASTEADPEDQRNERKLDFLLENESIFSDALSVTQDVLKRLEECSEIRGPQKEILVACLEAEGGCSAFQRILALVKEERVHVPTVVSLLRLHQDRNPAVRAVLAGRTRQDAEAAPPKAPSPPGSREEGKTLSALLLEHKEDLMRCVTQLSPVVGFLETAGEEVLTAAEKKVILNCCEGAAPRETIENLLHRVTQDKTLAAESLVKLLQAVTAVFPNLSLLLQKLQEPASLPDTTVQPSTDDYGTELLRRYQENLCEIFSDNQLLLQVISRAESLTPGEREVMEKLVKRDSGTGGFSSLISAVLEKQTLCATAIWQLLLVAQETKSCPVNLLVDEIHKEPGARAFFRAVAAPESAVLEIILRHKGPVVEAIQQQTDLQYLASEDEHLAEAVKEILSSSSETAKPEASLKALLSRAMEKSISAIGICRLLCRVHTSASSLQPVMRELAHVGFLTKEAGPEVRWKVSKAFHLETSEKADEKAAERTEEDGRPRRQDGEDEAGPLPGPEKDAPGSPDSAKRSFVCKACDKSFHFYCRLKVHVKRCRAAQRKEGSEAKASREGPETLGTGQEPHPPKKKKKRLPVTCDLCGREFAHASGMQYHKLTEHFDEKPFSCEECGAKFAANSTLKNHLRLHTGDRPFMCKHCLMTFTQASALAYHTKKKHSEGKMYACQYCDAVFAQSIELSRHVRTHTGDKPYVCRDCGKGFRQANGLSIHLHTFHNIEDPYDCKKCRMSFPTLQEHRKHIHEVHSKEYHPCPTCGKIFSAPSMLERHMVTHVGGKPFSCGICNKAYQQLSGLWYHNRTHHPDVFAAQNHRSSKFSSLQCSSCDRTFPNAAEHKKHIKAEHADVRFHECDKCKELFPTPALLQVHIKCQHSGAQPFRCLYCSATFRFPGALQHHVTTEHFKQSENTFPCELCGELFTAQTQLDSHLEAEHPRVTGTETPAAASQVVQVAHVPEPAAPAEQVITLEGPQLAGSQVFVTLPDSQAPQSSSELVAVTVEDLLDGTVTLIYGEAK